MCHPHDPAAELVDQLRRSGTSRALVVESGRLVGLVTQADLVVALAPGHGAPLGRHRCCARPSSRVPG